MSRKEVKLTFKTVGFSCFGVIIVFIVSIISISSVLGINDDTPSSDNLKVETTITSITPTNSDITNTIEQTNIPNVTTTITENTTTSKDTTIVASMSIILSAKTSLNEDITASNHVNVLMQSKFETEEDDDIKYGYINISKNDLLNITEDDLKEFANTYVTNNTELNWITIICDDGTGIHFTGNDTSFITYGDMFEYGAGLLGNTKVYILQDYGETNYYTSIVTEKETESHSADYTYVVNTKTKKYHKSSCTYANKIDYKNKDYLTMSEIISQGYSPCKYCNP